MLSMSHLSNHLYIHPDNTNTKPNLYNVSLPRPPNQIRPIHSDLTGTVATASIHVHACAPAEHQRKT
jgi:bis(5'-adenosyl)-triphosphatase